MAKKIWIICKEKSLAEEGRIKGEKGREKNKHKEDWGVLFWRENDGG